MVRNKRPQNLPEWQDMFFNIYGERNKMLYTPESCLLHVVEELRGFAQWLRKERVGDVGVKDHIAVAFGWLLGFWNYIHVDVEEALWEKYPNVCPYCFQDAKCFCISEGLKYHPTVVKLNAFRHDTTNMPRSLFEWQEMHARLYGNVNKITAQYQVFSHFIEEIGEMSYEYRHKNNQALREESADVMMWLFAFCTRIDVNLDELVWHTYPAECNRCEKHVCECPYV